MFLKSFILSLIAATLAGADPLVGNHSAHWEVYEASGAIVPPQPVPPAPYESLYWDIITIPGYCGRECAIIANTFPVYALFNETKPASASAKYHGSKVLSFDLQNFAYGCAASRGFTGPSGDGSQTYYIDAPVNCTLQVDGYKTDSAVGRPAVSKNLRFTPALFVNPQGPGTPSAQMQVYDASAFRGLRYVRFTPKLAPDNYPLAGPLKAYIDTINYRTFNFTA